MGSEMCIRDRLLDLSMREGSTGVLVFTKIVNRIYNDDGLCVVEERDGVFREGLKPGAKSGIPKRDPVPDGLPWQREINPDIVQLFRYSAITFNPHRIHYDRTYAMEVEGYPGLVVHGPFTTQCLLDLVRDMNPGKSMKNLICAPARRCSIPRRSRSADGQRTKAARSGRQRLKGRLRCRHASPSRSGRPGQMIPSSSPRGLARHRYLPPARASASSTRTAARSSTLGPSMRTTSASSCRWITPARPSTK